MDEGTKVRIKPEFIESVGTCDSDLGKTSNGYIIQKLQENDVVVNWYDSDSEFIFTSTINEDYLEEIKR